MQNLPFRPGDIPVVLDPAIAIGQAE